MREIDVQLDDGRTLHGYDRAPDGTPIALTVLWHHGTPNIGTPPAPLFAASDRLGIRWLGYDRPGYGGSRASSAGTSHRRRPMRRPSPMPLGSSASPSWGTPVAVRTRSPVPR